jgi:hypothetical protein
MSNKPQRIADALDDLIVALVCAQLSAKPRSPSAEKSDQKTDERSRAESPNADLRSSAFV